MRSIILGLVLVLVTSSVHAESTPSAEQWRLVEPEPKPRGHGALGGVIDGLTMLLLSGGVFTALFLGTPDKRDSEGFVIDRTFNRTFIAALRVVVTGGAVTGGAFLGMAIAHETSTSKPRGVEVSPLAAIAPGGALMRARLRL